MEKGFSVGAIKNEMMFNEASLSDIDEIDRLHVGNIIKVALSLYYVKKHTFNWKALKYNEKYHISIVFDSENNKQHGLPVITYDDLSVIKQTDPVYVDGIWIDYVNNSVKLHLAILKKDVRLRVYTESITIIKNIVEQSTTFNEVNKKRKIDDVSEKSN